MHSEQAALSEGASARLNAVHANGGRICAVGTTSLRTLESAADESGILHPFDGETDIFITPGYRFRTVDMLLTNFHLPRSTLFMLVAAFSGLETIRAAYAEAIAHGYRFYSYGDPACYADPRRPGCNRRKSGCSNGQARLIFRIGTIGEAHCPVERCICRPAHCSQLRHIHHLARGPSGFDVSKVKLPFQPAIAAMRSANSRTLISAPDPTLICPSPE